MDAGNWITLAIFGASLALAGLSAYWALNSRVTRIEARCENHQATLDSIANINSKLDKLASDNEMFWRILGPHLAGIIHSPQAYVRDELVDKLTSGDISDDDLRMVISLLREAIESDRWTAEKRFAGAMLLARACTMLSERGGGSCLS